jgi:predicted outer membrane repeat protein
VKIGYAEDKSMKITAHTAMPITALLLTLIFVSPLAAEDFTLSDEGLMMLHVGTYYYGATASIISKRDIPGPGIEYKIHFPGTKESESTLSMVCNNLCGSKDPIVGVNVGKYDHFALKFTLISIDGKTTSEAGGRLCVGAEVGCDGRHGGFRPMLIGFGENLEPNDISATSLSRISLSGEGEILSNIGFIAYIDEPNGWDPNGSTIKLLVEPAPAAVAIPEQQSQRKYNPAKGKYIYVDATAAETGDGTAWDKAFKYLQDALAVASKGDQIWVARGIYKPNQVGKPVRDEDAATFMLKNGVTIYGGFPTGGSGWENSDPLVNETILSGDLKGDDAMTNNLSMLLTDPTRSDNVAHVVKASGTDETAVLDGFIITAGNARGGRDRWPKEPLPTQGGGLYCKAGSPTIINCIFKLNSAPFGGAVYFWRGNPTLINCRFVDNFAEDSGAGIHLSECNATIVNCVFVKNSAVEKGGAIYNEANKAKIINCTIAKNYAYAGGGVYNQKSTPTVTNCILWGNTSRYGSDEPAQLYGVKVEASHCCIQGLTPQLGGKDCLVADPLIIDDYRLSAGSPCINAGDSKAIPDGVETDIDGNFRIAGTAVDIGAVEAH